MKTGVKIGLLLVLLMAGSVAAGDVSVVYVDGFAAAADTAANAKRNDTVYTSYIPIIDASRLWVSFATRGLYSDSNGTIYDPGDDSTFVNDTFFVYFQTSSDRINWYNYGSWTQTVVPNTSGNDTTVNITVSITRDSTLWVGDYGRLKVACHHQLAADAPTTYLKNYAKLIIGYINKVP